MPGVVPLLLALALVPATVVSWRRTGLKQGRTALAIGWTWLWAELGCAIAFAPPPPPGPVPIYQAGGRHHLRVAPDMLAMPRPDPDTPFVLFVGDSFTAGQGVRLPQAFPSRLAAAWREQAPALVALNHGVPGASFFSQALRYSLLSRTDAPDVVVWTHGPSARRWVPWLADKLILSREHHVVFPPAPRCPSLRTGQGWTTGVSTPEGYHVYGCRWVSPSMEIEVQDNEAPNDRVVQRLVASARDLLHLEGEPLGVATRRLALSCDGLPIVGPRPGAPQWVLAVANLGQPFTLGTAMGLTVSEGLFATNANAALHHPLWSTSRFV